MEKYDVNQPVQLKKGVYKLNAERNFDYQLNRVIASHGWGSFSGRELARTNQRKQERRKRDERKETKRFGCLAGIRGQP